MRFVFHSLLAGAALVLVPWAAGFEYHNPVRAGDYPDPSVIRVGDEYWAASTSSEWAPYFPLLHSRDLVNWEVAGSVFSHAPTWAKSNFWAPEIFAFHGKFFVYFVARDRSSNRLAVAVATADRPGGPYTDHGPLVSEPAGSIDPMPFTDAEGQRWLIWKNDGNSVRQPTPIWIQRLSDDGLSLLGERRELIHNDAPWEHAVVEGPFMLRHGDYYYLFYSGGACCGRNCNYALGVARARRLEGPWEKSLDNPILASNADWRCPGHGSIVTDPDGRSWLLYHSYSQAGFVATGREMMLDEVVFGADGWPSLNGGHGPSSRAQSPAAVQAQPAVTGFTDDFRTGETLSPEWQWLVGRRPQAQVGGGRLTLTAQQGTGVVARAVTTPSYVVETRISTHGLGDGVFAGLATFGDHANEIALVTNGRRVEVWSWRGRLRSTVAQVDAQPADELGLRMACVGGNRFRFAVQDRTGSWREVGDSTDGSYLPPWDRGLRAGLCVSGPEKSQAAFLRFSLTPGDEHFLTP